MQVGQGSWQSGKWKSQLNCAELDIRSAYGAEAGAAKVSSDRPRHAVPMPGGVDGAAYLFRHGLCTIRSLTCWLFTYLVPTLLVVPIARTWLLLSASTTCTRSSILCVVILPAVTSLLHPLPVLQQEALPQSLSSHRMRSISVHQREV